MKIITRTLLGLSLPALLLATGSSYAAASLQNVDTTIQPSGKSVLRLHFDSKVGMPKSFVMQQSSSIVLDFPGAATAMSKRSKNLNSKTVKSVKFAKGANKLRVMVSLNKLPKYTTSIRGNDVVLTFDDNQTVAKRPVIKRQTAATMNRAKGPVVRQKSVRHQAVASNYVARPRTAAARYRPAQQRAVYRGSNVLGPVDFQRTQDGGGRAIIKLPHPATKVESRKVGNTVVITLKNVKARQPKKRIDVLDFATPASYIDIARSGRDVQIKILANAAFDYSTSKNGNNFIVNMAKSKKKIVRANPLSPKKKTYHGKKLSLNFQDIEVRSVLQLLADFTDKNIVVSDSVAGNITLRLKDVPWDQALDIVLESKGLGMRNNGNVIWVAPASELEAKEQRDLQALKRKQALEPLVTEYIPVNYAKASDIVELVRSAGGKGEGSLLSKRGSVTLDKRTNTLLVQDTASRVNDIREMVKNLDVTVRQVSIESRIVVATDEFSKDLGTRFGVTTFGKHAALSGGVRGTDAMVGDLLRNSSTVPVPALSDRLNFNLPAATAGAAKMALSLLSKDFLLDLELSALQAENKGEIISTPRVVTADKKAAMIEQGVEIGYKTESQSGGTTVAFKKAVLSLQVTPQITPDEHVIMDLLVKQDTVGDIIEGVPSINTREVQTQVLVDNGQTVVLGGVHEAVKTNKVESVPVLGDVPVLGQLFKRSVNRDQKRELLIFVTPKIIK